MVCWFFVQLTANLFLLFIGLSQPARSEAGCIALADTDLVGIAEDIASAVDIGSGKLVADTDMRVGIVWLAVGIAVLQMEPTCSGLGCLRFLLPLQRLLLPS